MTEEEKKAQNRQKANRLNGQISSKKSSVASHESKVAELDKKIERLKKAKEALKEQDKSFKNNVIRKDNDVRNGRYKWKGSWYDITFKAKTSRLNEHEKTYERAVDHRIDLINTEIGRLERERASHKSIISQLWADIKSLGRQIENLVT